MNELEDLRKQIAYLKRVRETAWRQLTEKDAEIKRLRARLERKSLENHPSPIYRSRGTGRRWERA